MVFMREAKNRNVCSVAVMTGSIGCLHSIGVVSFNTLAPCSAPQSFFE